MTKKSMQRLEKDGVLSPLQTKRNLTPVEMMELQEMIRLSNSKRFEATQIKGNTALIPRGQEVAAEAEAVARLLENAKNQFVSQLLVQCGYPAGTKCSLNLTTGEIVPEAGVDNSPVKA